MVKMKERAFSKGFTLIELLVVIAIIGLLAAVVLASVNSARGKGGDAAVQSNVNSIRDQAEIVYDGASPNAYTGMCTNTTVAAALAQAQSAGGTGAYVTNNTAVANATNSSAKGACNVESSGASYAVEMPLKTNSLQLWCVDSSGKAEQTGTVITATTLCP